MRTRSLQPWLWLVALPAGLLISTAPPAAANDASKDEPPAAQSSGDESGADAMPHWPAPDEQLHEAITQIDSSDSNMITQGLYGLNGLMSEHDPTARRGARAMQPAVVRLLGHENPDVRQAALTALGGFTEDLQVLLPAYKTALRDPSANVRATATDELGKLGPEAAGVTGDLLAMLTEPEAHNVANALRKIDPQAMLRRVNPLLRTLYIGDPQQRTAAARALGAIGPVPLPPTGGQVIGAWDDSPFRMPGAGLYYFTFAQGLEYSPLFVKMGVIQPPVAIDPTTAKVIPALMRALGDSGDAREAAIYALSNFGPYALSAKGQLEELEESDESRAVKSALQLIDIDPKLDAGPDSMFPLDSLGEPDLDLLNRNVDDTALVMRPLRAEDVPKALEGLRNSDGTERSKWARALTFRTFNSPELVQALLDAMQDKEGAVVTNVVGALASHIEAAPQAIQLMAAKLDQEDEFTAWSAGHWLIVIGERGPQWKQRVNEAVFGTHLNADVRAMVLGALSDDPAEALPLLACALHSRQDTVMGTATWFLARLGPEAKPVVPELQDMTRSDFLPAQMYAGMALGGIDPSAAAPMVPQLSRWVNYDGDWGLMAAWLLGRIGPPAGDAIPALRNALYDPDADKRLTAAVALKRIQAN